jgi:tRNA pseudouridine synthase 10
MNFQSLFSKNMIGYYVKFSRYLSQSPWILDNQRIGKTSIEELIGIPLMQFFRSDQFRFSSAGREDIDVRMLGNGRPFAIELINPRAMRCISMDELHTNVSFRRIEDEINGKTKFIQVNKLSELTEDRINLLKEAGESKKKMYR